VKLLERPDVYDNVSSILGFDTVIESSESLHRDLEERAVEKVTGVRHGGTVTMELEWVRGLIKETAWMVPASRFLVSSMKARVSSKTSNGKGGWRKLTWIRHCLMEVV
jgi:hypothetical protein